MRLRGIGMKGNIKRIVTVLAVFFAFAFLFVGCSSSGEEEAGAYVVSIAQTSSDENGTEYTVYYSDGSTSTFTVANGKDGADGEDGKDGANGQDGDDITAADLYEEYVARYGDELTYAEFLEKYLGQTKDNSAAIASAVRSAVSVYAEFTVTTVSAGLHGVTYTDEIALAGGSGVIYRVADDYTYILTNYHVVYDSEANADNGSNIGRKIVCYLYGSEYAPARTTEKDDDGYTVVEYSPYAVECEFLGGSVSADLALLRAETAALKAIREDIVAAEFADGYAVGETCFAVGNAEGEGLSVTQGIVSVDGEYITLDDIDGTARSYRSVRIDTAIYPGNSGGGLFNAEGKLIGITNAGEGTDQNINYAIPLGIVRGVADNLYFYYADGDSATQGAYKITLGVTVTSSGTKYVYDAASGTGRMVSEITVSEISSGSIAASLGLQEGDVLTAMRIGGADTSVYCNYDIGDALYTVRVGDEISFTLMRGEETMQSAAYTVQAADLVAVE